MAARLKVFVTSDGLTDYVVAASSRPKALAAWGAHQDLFKTGGARETDDPALVKAATAQPGEVLRRPTDAKVAPTKAVKPAKPKGPSKAALKKVADLEAKLEVLQTRRVAAEDEIAMARAALEERDARQRARFDAETEKLEGAVQAARRAL